MKFLVQSMTYLLPLKKRLSLLKRRWLDGYAVKSYSNEGEDMILRKIFDSCRQGFYVDVGAHHPMRFSNTYFFYKQGWRGINIDAMPGSMRLFNKWRSRDINLEHGISDTEADLEYYMFNEPALNGFSASLSALRESDSSKSKIIGSIRIEVKRLEAVLDIHLPAGQPISFLTVDAESYDLQVLRSNNWERYRPAYVLAEVRGSSLSDISEDRLSQFMLDQEYEIFAKTVQTVFYRRKG